MTKKNRKALPDVLAKPIVLEGPWDYADNYRSEALKKLQRRSRSWRPGWPVAATFRPPGLASRHWHQRVPERGVTAPSYFRSGRCSQPLRPPCDS